MRYIIRYDNEYYRQPLKGTTPNREDAHIFTKEELAKLDLHPDVDIVEEVSPKAKILILGDAQHGKDTLAEMMVEEFNLTCKSSSRFALETFLFDILRDKYNLNYKSNDEAYLDRVNHRKKWFDEICSYNSKDKLRLAKKLLKEANIYIGLRRDEEVEEAIKKKTFDKIIGIYDYRKPRESKESNTADVFKYSDIVIMNNGTLEDLKNKLKSIKL